MKIFESVEKVNFVDENNVFVGYDLSNDWCEEAGWFLSESVTGDIPDTELGVDLKDYVFDPTFFEYVDSKAVEEGGMAAFRIVNSEEGERFLHLYNCHNGYYGHQFEVKHNGLVVNEGDL